MFSRVTVLIVYARCFIYCHLFVVNLILEDKLIFGSSHCFTMPGGNVGDASEADDDKDALIAVLKSQNVNLQNQITDLNKKIDVLSANLLQLTAQLTSTNTTRALKRKQTQIGNSSNKTKIAKPISSYFNNVKNNSAAKSDTMDTSETDDADTDSISNEFTSTTRTLPGDGDQYNLNSTAKAADVPIQLPKTNEWANVVLNNAPIASGPKPSPIQLAAMDKSTYATIINGLFDKFGGKGYRWQQLKSFSLPRILTDDLDTKHKVKEWLDAGHHEYNSYAERGQKRKSYLLRGLIHGSDETNVESIGRALADVGVTGDATITRFLTGYMKRNPNNNAAPIYQITLDHNSDDSNISKIATINNFCVRFEKMKPSRIIQCHRCQRLSHTAAMCSHNYRCVQCVHSHEPGCCPRSTNKNLPIGCVNCAAADLPHTGHTANDLRKCAFYNNISKGANKSDVSKVAGISNHSSSNAASVRFQHVNIEEPVRANNPNLKKGNKKNSNKKTSTSTNSSSVSNAGNNGLLNGKGSDSHVKSNSGVNDLVNALMQVLARFK